MAKTEATPETEAQAAAPDYVSHIEAQSMFKENPGLNAVRAQLDDGRIGDLLRSGEFRELAQA